jgi:hypothetical protein
MNRTVAYFLSVVGHPMLVLTTVLALMIAGNPYAFGVRSIGDQRSVLLLVAVFVCTALIPAVGVAMMRSLGFIRTVHMHDKQERIGPYILSGVFYLWLFKNLLSAGQAPPLFVAFVLGSTIALFLTFFINIFTKISAHAAGMGGFATMLACLAWIWPDADGMVPIGSLSLSWVLLLALGTLLAGAVGTARLALQAHTPADLYRGYAVGIGSVLLAVAYFGQ